MDNDFDKFITKAKELGLCKEYSQKIDSAMSKKQVMDIALDANGVSWLCDSIAQGWGLTPNYIARNYANFLNARYVYHGKGYTSAIYCQNDNIDIKTTVSCVIECNGEIHSDRLSEMHIVNSKVSITGEGRSIVYLYNSQIVNRDEFNGTIVKEVNY
jgi:hypothetical protein